MTTGQAGTTRNGGQDAVSEGIGGQRWLAIVTVMPKAGVNDPEGDAILGGLRSLGHQQVARVRAGSIFHVLLDAADQASAETAARTMADQLLANPVIEQFVVDVSPAPAGA
jgi:phosphoribosylformylglycinamidine synthase subunit PurS